MKLEQALLRPIQSLESLAKMTVSRVGFSSVRAHRDRENPLELCLVFEKNCKIGAIVTVFDVGQAETVSFPSSSICKM